MKAKTRFSDEERAFIIESVQKGIHPRDVWKIVKEKFCAGRSYRSIENLLTNNHVSYDGLVPLDWRPRINGATPDNPPKPLITFNDLQDLASSLGYSVLPKYQDVERNIDIDPDIFKGKTYKIGLVSDTHLCLSSRTKIITNTGIKRINRIKSGDLVLTHKNRFQKVIKTYKSSSKGKKLLEIRFRMGGTNDKIVITPNHPMLVWRSHLGEVWLYAGEVRKGDFVLSIPVKCRWCGASIPYWRKTCNECDPYTKSKARARKERWMMNYDKSKNEQSHYYRDILPYAEKLRQDGWRVIPIGRVYPDIIGIKNDKIVAFEIESSYRNGSRGQYKYSIPEMSGLYDKVEWIFLKERKKYRNWRYQYTEPNKDGLIGIQVVGVKQVEMARYLYNLEVEEDNSYIANNVAVHNCSRFQQLTYLHNAYGYMNSLGIKVVLHSGDLTDGWTVYRGHLHEAFIIGNDAQANYAIKNYPKYKGVTTHVISGQHDYSFWKDRGYNILEHISQERPDIRFINHFGGYINIGHIRIYLHHPGGGMAYARSYKTQKWINDVTPENKPNILIRGHHHVFNHLLYRNVIAIDLPCFQSQTPYLKEKGLSPEIGFCILNLTVNDVGVDFNTAGYTVQHYPFFIPKEQDY